MKVNGILTKTFGMALIFLVLGFSTILGQQRISGKLVKTGIWQGQEIEYLEGQILIKLKTGYSKQDILPVLAQHQAVITEGFDKLRWAMLEVPSSVDIFSVINDLKDHSMVEAAEPNGVMYTHDVNDPFFVDGTQWALRNTGQDPPGGFNDADIDAPEAWDITRGSSNIMIAILDSGIPMQNGSLSHLDLDDSNKFILGPDFIDDPGTPEYNEGVRDRLGHGTHVAGIATAETNNGEGIAGVAGSCKVMIVQVFNANGASTWSTFEDGVVYAVDNGADVINYSGGRSGVTDPDTLQVIEDAVAYAQANNVTLVASAGNCRCSSVGYPAKFSSQYDNVIAVSSTDHKDNFSVNFSSFGPEIIVAAPGGFGNSTPGLPADANDIYSTTPNYPFTLENETQSPTQTYGYLFGTSMAAPHVTGTVALLLSVNNMLSPNQIRDILEETAFDVYPDGEDNLTGHGRINAYEALKYTMENYGGTLEQSFTIANGETFNIQPGVTLKFAPGTSLIVEGTLNVNGEAGNEVTFTRTGTSGDWDGIRFNSGASGDIDHAVIEYALNSDGIDINSASPTIKNTTIQNCLFGLNLNNCNSLIQYCIVQNNEEGIFDRYGAVQYLDNTIKDQTPGLGDAHGLFLDATDPVLFRNAIDNNETGVYGINGAYAQFGSSGQTGNNVIRNNDIGLLTYGSGTFLYLGGDSWGGDNSIYNTNWDAVAHTGSWIVAQYCWWGSPGGGNVYYDGSSIVDDSFPLASDPNSGMAPSSFTPHPSVAHSGNAFSAASGSVAKIDSAVAALLQMRYLNRIG